MNGRRLLGFAVGMVIVAVLFWLLWRLANSVAGSLSDVPAPIASAVIVAIGGAVGWLTNRMAARIDATASAHRDKKIEIHSKFTDEVLNIFMTDEFAKSIGVDPEEASSNLTKGLIRFQREILFWGSPKVIQAHLECRKYPNDAARLGVALNQLFKAMRSDIGLSNWGIGQDDLTKLVTRYEYSITPKQ